MGFSRQEYWSGLPFPSPGYLPDPGIEPRSPALRADTLTSEPPGKPSKGGGGRQLDLLWQLASFCLFCICVQKGIKRLYRKIILILALFVHILGDTCNKECIQYCLGDC